MLRKFEEIFKVSEDAKKYLNIYHVPEMNSYTIQFRDASNILNITKLLLNGIVFDCKFDHMSYTEKSSGSLDNNLGITEKGAYAPTMNMSFHGTNFPISISILYNGEYTILDIETKNYIDSYKR